MPKSTHKNYIDIYTSIVLMVTNTVSNTLSTLVQKTIIKGQPGAAYYGSFVGCEVFKLINTEHGTHAKFKASPKTLSKQW